MVISYLLTVEPILSGLIQVRTAEQVVGDIEHLRDSICLGGCLKSPFLTPEKGP